MGHHHYQKQGSVISVPENSIHPEMACIKPKHMVHVRFKRGLNSNYCNSRFSFPSELEAQV
jgi:hypothetical protein